MGRTKRNHVERQIYVERWPNKALSLNCEEDFVDNEELGGCKSTNYLMGIHMFTRKTNQC